MIVQHDVPPNYRQIVAAFPGAREPGVMFCYGDIIYYPGSGTVPPRLLAHEQVHSIHQGSRPDLWWDYYINDPKFRLQEEAMAHRAELRYMIDHAPSRQGRRRALQDVAGRFADPLYDMGLNKARARKILRHEGFDPSLSK